MNALTIMIIKDDCEWNWTLDDKNNHLEKSELVVEDIVMQLIFDENHKIWFFDIQDILNEVYRKWINLVFWQIILIDINNIFVNIDISDHVRVKDLNNLEFVILSDFQSRSSI
jgi:hypothetical protein